MSTNSHDRSVIAEVTHAMGTSADRAATDRDRAQREVREGGAAFGTDAAGRALLARYAPSATTVLGNVAQVATQLDAITNRLGRMGGAYTDVEQAAVEASTGGAPTVTL